MIAAVLLVLATAAAARAAHAATRQHLVRRRLADRSVATATPGWARYRSMLPSPPSWVGRRLDGAGIEAPPDLVWAGAIAAIAAVGVVGSLAGGLPLGLLATAGAVSGGALVLRSRRGQGDARLERGLPAALEAVARALRSGASLRQAIGEAGEATPGRLGRELVLVARQAAGGIPLVTALEALADRRPAPGVRLASAALCLGVETGGAQARAVDGVAATLRDRLGVAAEVKALASQARVSALVIGLAPLAFGGFAAATDPRTARFVFHTGLGWAILTVGLTLDAAGWAWMQRLARVAP